MRNVQIPFELFYQLLQYHLMENHNLENSIKQGLEKKLDALVMHELYGEIEKRSHFGRKRESPTGVSGQARSSGGVSMVVFSDHLMTGRDTLLYQWQIRQGFGNKIGKD